MTMGVDYVLDGTVNGVPLNAEGVGTVSTEDGSLTMDIHISKVPLNYDPALIILMCSTSLESAASKEIGGAKNLLSLCLNRPKSLQGDVIFNMGTGNNWGREAYIATMDGLPVAHIAAISQVEQKSNGRLLARSQVVSGVCNMGDKTRIKSIELPIFGALVPFGPGYGILNTHYFIHTEDGQRFRGRSFYPISFSETMSLPGPQIWKAQHISHTLERSSDRSAHLQFKVISAVKLAQFEEPI